MTARRLLAAAFLAASLAPVAAMAQTTTDDQPSVRQQSQGAQAKPDHATAEHAKPGHHVKAEHTRPAHEQRGGEAMTSGGAAPTAPAGVKPATTTAAPATSAAAPTSTDSAPGTGSNSK